MLKRGNAAKFFGRRNLAFAISKIVRKTRLEGRKEDGSEGRGKEKKIVGEIVAGNRKP